MLIHLHLTEEHLHCVFVGDHFGVDLIHRKAEVKEVITDVINNMTDEEDEGEEEEDEKEDDASEAEE